MSAPRTRFVAGCMTGTSLDGIDVALAEITGRGLEMKVKFHGLVSKPLGALADQLRHFAEGKPAAPIDFLRAARTLGEIHAEAVEELREKHAGSHTLDFIVAHGQTIWHAPNEKLSWQLFDPWPLVRRLGVPVCYDLRQADLIAGGQGAPISPIADWVMYRRPPRQRVIVNLGGICNITRLGASPGATAGGDVGPCNIVLDTVVQRLFPFKRYDEDGQIARSGQVVQMLLQAIVIDVTEAMKSQRSLGREQFPMSLLDQWLATARKYEKPQDIVATYVAAIADLIVIAIRKVAGVDEVVLAGGGARNPALVDAIRSNDQANFDCLLTDDVGIPCEAREAQAFAVLGALSQDGVPITLPQVTGATNPGRAGSWAYP